MDKVNGKLTVYFEEPFWVGVFERIEDGKLICGEGNIWCRAKRLRSARLYSKILFQFEIQSGC